MQIEISKKLKKKVIAEIERIKSRAGEMADFIFDNPEIGTKESAAKKYLAGELEKNGFFIKDGIKSLPTAFKAEFDLGKNGPGIALLAEYDALPKIGHACHHHIIASSSVNTAIALSRLKEDLCGKILVIGTPAEESMEAKEKMWQDGMFKNTDVALMFHGGPQNNTDLIVLAMDDMEFSYSGRASHAASAPDGGINALDAVILLFNSINALRQQLKDDVKIHGIITRGGDAPNIIPDNAAARFQIRAMQRKYLDEVIEKVKNCAKGAALQTGTKLVTTQYEHSGNELIKNLNLIEEFERNFKDIGGKLDSEPFLIGSSDIGNLSYHLPVLHPMVQTAGRGSMLHSEKFLKYGKSSYAYTGMVLGMKAIALTAIKLMLDKKYLSDVRLEFQESIKK